MSKTSIKLLLPIMLLVSSPVAADTLRWATANETSSMDPHFARVDANKSLARHIFDPLVRSDANLQPTPGLAESWDNIDDLTWEFKLRPNVKFHNGEPFTAEDVKYSIERIPTITGSSSPYTVHTSMIESIEIVDPLTIRLKTADPYPLMPRSLAEISILPHSLGEIESNAFNSPEAVIGTGPYRFVSRQIGERITLTVNEDYWGERPEFEDVEFIVMPNAGARVAALRAGDVDIIESPNSADVPHLQANDDFTVTSKVSYRIIYLGLNQFSDEMPAGVSGTDGKNPFKDQRVREAISIAINRDGIAARIMGGESSPANQVLSPVLSGFDTTLPEIPFDPERARALLAEAGYPDGFSLTLSATNDRYINDASVAQAIAANLTQVGLRTSVQIMPSNVFLPRWGKQEYSFFMVGSGVSTGEGSYGLRNVIATYNPDIGMGISNNGRYSNPKVDELLISSLTTIDEDERTAKVQEATRIAMEEVGIIPLHWEHSIWASQAGIEYPGRVDQSNVAMDVVHTE